MRQLKEMQKTTSKGDASSGLPPPQEPQDYGSFDNEDGPREAEASPSKEESETECETNGDGSPVATGTMTTNPWPCVATGGATSAKAHAGAAETLMETVAAPLCRVGSGVSRQKKKGELSAKTLRS